MNRAAPRPRLLAAAFALAVTASAVAAPAVTAPAAAAPEPKAAAKGPIPPPLAPHFQQVRDKIDALLHNRGATPPPPDPRFDPFRAPGALAAAPAPVDPNAPPGTEPTPTTTPSTDLAQLQQAVATLKVNGGFERGGVHYLLINGRPYKQGDAIQAQVLGQPVVLRVRQISGYMLTLALNDTEMTLKF